MSKAVVVSAARTAVATARKGSLADTTAETLARVVVEATLRRSGVDPKLVDDIVLAESLYGGGDLARHAAVEAGLLGVPGVAVNRHCAGSLTAVGMAAGSIVAGMDRVVIAGGAQASSMAPKMSWRASGATDFTDNWAPPSHPDTPDAPNRDMSITVGWNTARIVGISRQDMDAWALRSHQRAVAAIDAGKFKDEIVAVSTRRLDGTPITFEVDEHPRRDSSMERLASLKVLHPEIDGFSITAGNSSGINDSAAALMLADEALAKAEGLVPMARILSWAASAVDPVRTGLAVLDVIPKVLQRAGVSVRDVALWEINEAFASVPIAACRTFDLDEDRVNFSGSGCSIGHPIAASGARMLNTLIYELRRKGGGIGVATMCAGGGQAGAVVIEV